MPRDLNPVPVRPRQFLGLLLAVLAFVSQLALGAMVLPDGAATRQDTEFDAISILCRTGAPAGHRSQPDGHGHAAGWALCPLGIALALPAVVLSPAPGALPRRAAATIRFWTGGTARGPPSRSSPAGLPRGPPVLV